VYTIVVLVRVRTTIENLEKEARELSTRTLPVLDNLEAVTARLKSIAESVDEQVSTVRESFASIRQVADNIAEMERRVQERVEGPFLEAVGFIVALVKGVRTFMARVRP
jgi:methyl-accepting chemotaxis protein